jgi:phage gp36-like protein
MSNPYASLADLPTYGLPATALGTLTPTQQQDALDSSAGVVDSHLRGRYNLPLLAPIPVELTEVTCAIAGWRLMQVRGLNPASPDYVAFRDRYLDAMSYLGKVQRQAAHPNVVQAASGGQFTQPTVLSSSVAFLNSGASLAQRGW